MEQQQMNWTLEVVIVPVSDVERAKMFYAQKIGFHLDHDTQVSDTLRVVQLTPRGSGCSIVIGSGLTQMEPGCIKGLQLVVNDIQMAHAFLVQNEVEVSEITRMGENRPDFDGDPLDYVGFVFFSDPDGNQWAIQQISSRP
jgi:catechol 2,3-dioxygenase-like lactoylglutathione lyase family enzyme